MDFHLGIDIVEIWFGIANGQILSIIDKDICLQQDNDVVLSFHIFIIYKLQEAPLKF